ncbi:MAG: porin, partial [Sterolibacterium sp.]
MQKKIIALAVAALASGAAFAQTNVTLYGVADASFDNVRVSGEQSTADKISHFSRVSTNSSLIGFKGAEDLGGGMKALFQFEGGVGFDATPSSGFAFTRDSFVGLTGGFGTVVLGTLTGPARALGSALDVNAGATGIGANSAILGKLGGLLVGGFNSAAPLVAATATAVATGPVNVGAACGRSSTCTSPFDTRYSNAIAYVSPNLSGFTLTIGYIPNENKSRNGESGTATQANSKA